MDDEFKDLQRLLRLKRYEAPPPEYFDDFLLDFHRRQRAELLKRPLWRLIVDRIEGALPAIPVTRYAYAGACATAVAAAVLASGNMQHTAPAARDILASSAASLPATTALAAGTFRPSHALAANARSPRISILSSKPLPRLSPELDFDRPRPAMASYAGSRPRYVLDTQPVSYEQPFSF